MSLLCECLIQLYVHWTEFDYLYSTPPSRWMGNLTVSNVFVMLSLYIMCTWPKSERQYGSQGYRQHASFIMNSACSTEGRERGSGSGNKWTHSSFNTPSSPPRFSEMVYHRKERDIPVSAGQSLGRAGLRVGRLPAHKHD